MHDEPVHEETVRDTTETARKASAPMTAAAGAVAGATAALVTPLGPLAAGVGAIIGALGGAAVGAAAGAATGADAFTNDDDAHYHALWDGTPTRPADWSYERARPAYQFGHVAAQHDAYLGRTFDAAEPDLRRVWDRDLATQYGAWETVRRYVCDAYGHARSLGYGVRRDLTLPGPAGSAVDPVELERARRGEPSVDTPVPGGIVIGEAGAAEENERAELTPNEARRDTHELQ